MKATNLLAFLGGAAAGAVIALLTSPKNGPENRQIVAEKLKSGAELSKKELQDLMAWVQEKIQEREAPAKAEPSETEAGL